MKSFVHAGAGGLAMLTITTFLGSTVYVELFGTSQMITEVKNAIVFPGLAILIPLMILTGGLGRVLSGNRTGRLARQKMQRMKIIAALGALVLVPSALLLAYLASNQFFGPLFIGVQLIEIVAGATNLTLLGRNMRDGFLLSKRLRSIRRRSIPVAAE